MSPAIFVFLVINLSRSVSSHPSYNVTVTVPEGFSNHGKDGLFCVPTKWYNIVIFFAVNYASHAATVKSRPGQTYSHSVRDVILALAFPYSGLLRAIDTISQFSWPNEHALVKAARADALCMISRESLALSGIKLYCKTAHPNCHLGTAAEDLEMGLQPQVPRSQHDMEPGEMSTSKVNAIEPPGLSRTGGADDVLHAVEKDQSTVAVIAENDDINDDVDGSSLNSQERSHPFSSSEKMTRQSTLTKVETALSKAVSGQRRIHGVCQLPKGYTIAPLLAFSLKGCAIAIRTHLSENTANVTLSSSHNIPKAVVAIIQTIFASITLYQTRGDQIERYGYAAYGLTVLPYLIMSVMNLIATMLVPDYPATYILRSVEYDEAVNAGAEIDGAIGWLLPVSEFALRRSTSSQKNKITASYPTPPKDKDHDWRRQITKAMTSSVQIHNQVQDERLKQPLPPNVVEIKVRNNKYLRFDFELWIVTLIFGSIPMIIIGLLTHFHAGDSTKAQRVWTMTWLVFGIGLGPFLERISTNDARHSTIWGLSAKKLDLGDVVLLLVASLYVVPAIGGFVVVGQMLKEYGACSLMSGLEI